MVFNMDSVTFFLTYSYIYVELDCLFNISTIIVLHESLHTRTKVFVSKRKSIWTTIRAFENFCFSIVFNSSPALDRSLPFGYDHLGRATVKRAASEKFKS